MRPGETCFRNIPFRPNGNVVDLFFMYFSFLQIWVKHDESFSDSDLPTGLEGRPAATRVAEG